MYIFFVLENKYWRTSKTLQGTKDKNRVEGFRCLSLLLGRPFLTLDLNSAYRPHPSGPKFLNFNCPFLYQIHIKRVMWSPRPNDLKCPQKLMM